MGNMGVWGVAVQCRYTWFVLTVNTPELNTNIFSLKDICLSVQPVHINCPRELLKAKVFIWPYIPRLVLIRIQYEIIMHTSMSGMICKRAATSHAETGSMKWWKGQSSLFWKPSLISLLTVEDINRHHHLNQDTSLPLDFFCVWVWRHIQSLLWPSFMTLWEGIELLANVIKQLQA